MEAIPIPVTPAFLMTFNSYESVMCYCVFIKAQTKSRTTSLIVHTRGATGLSSNEISRVFQAEARLAAKRAARAEAREIRMKELERQQKEVPFTVASVPLSGIVILGRACKCRDTCCCRHTCPPDIAHDRNAPCP